MEYKQDRTETIISLFSTYANPSDPSRLTLSGVIALYSILQIDVENDIIVLYISYKMGCKCMYLYTKQEVYKLQEDYGIETFQDLSSILPEWRKELENTETFRDFYRYLFMYAVRSQSDCMRKRLHLQNAIHLWKVLFGDRFTIIQPFSDFLVSSREDDVGLRQDEWNMFFTFLQKHGNDTDLKSHFDFNYAWPLLLCEFVQSL